MAISYPPSTWAILLGMICAGAFRSILVKLAYQGGLRAPLTVTLLSFAGKGLALITRCRRGPLRGCFPGGGFVDEIDHDALLNRAQIGSDRYDDEQRDGDPVATLAEASRSSLELRDDDEGAQARACNDDDSDELNGSRHGLSRESEQRIAWVRRVPFLLRPAVPAMLALLANSLRWISLVYIDASVVEMLTGGLELILSVVAARIFRGRMVALTRWAGVAVVAAGAVVVEVSNGKESRDDGDGRGAGEVTLGLVLILFQSFLSVLQDLAEEIFMQAAGAEVPPMMLIGMEGAYGLAAGIVIVALAGDDLSGIEDFGATASLLRSNATARGWAAALPLVFLVMNVFNIKATEVTSAMTRNVWKTLRTALVWVIGLMIFYLGGNPALGEEWHVPGSFGILFGFSIMSAGILAYYGCS